MQYTLSLTNQQGILYNIPESILPVNTFVSSGAEAGFMGTDLELVKAFKSGDKNAFSELIKKYKDRIFNLAYAAVRDSHEADDITQEAFLKVYFRIGTFKERSSFFTWLYSIAVNECRHSMRNKKHMFVSLETPISEDDTAKLGDMLKSNEKDPESQLSDEEQSALAMKLIQTLPEKYKTMYILRNVDGLSYSEISDILDISIDSVKVGLFRAREKLDELITPLMNETTGGDGK